MFLLNDKMILDSMEERLLEIEDFDQKLLHPTYYLFRLGNYVTMLDVKGNHIEDLGEPGRKILIIPARGYAIIRSLERFKCSKRILALFGQHSSLPRKGLRLNHSPSIDPNFSGYLEMGLENLCDKPKEIKYGEIIGKVLFFNVHDTYPVSDIKGTISEKDYTRRETLEIPEPLK